MEQYDNNNDFEQFLKDKIDDFRMIPQRKVWYSIYNHLHPDRRWPSIAVCLLILVAILHIGISNNTAISKSTVASKELHEKNIELVNDHDVVDHNKQTLIASTVTDLIKTKNSTTASLQKAPSSTTLNNTSGQANTLPISANSLVTKSSSSNNTKNDEEHGRNLNNTEKSNNDFSVNITNSELSKLNSASNKEAYVKEKFTNTIVSDEEIDLLVNNISINKKVYHSDKIEQNKKPINLTVKESKLAAQNLASNAAQIKLPLTKEKNSITYYLTPSIGYRNLESIRSNKSINNFSSISPNDNSNNILQDEKALNLELGAMLEHVVAKNVRTKVGVQFNYTNYISKATELDHPIQNALAVGTQQNTFSSMSYYAKAGNINLNKSTLQVAVPIGVDYKILGNEKIKWYVGATIQPTYVIAGSAYLLSADGTNYSNEKSYLRKLNVNTAIETFLSIKTAKGIVLNVGPQFRYQVLSTYKNSYNYKENLYNLGVKIGVSTSF
jgi:hypothetical protein